MPRWLTVVEAINKWAMVLPPLGFAVTIATGNLDSIIWLSALSWLTWLDARFSAWITQVLDKAKEPECD